MSIQLEIMSVEISKLQLKSNDLLAIKFPINTLQADINYFIDDLKSILPEDMRVIFFRGDVEISIISKED